MKKIGNYNKLRVVKKVDFGLYLDGEEYGEILLPQKYVTDDMLPGEEVEIFLYRDSEDRLVATTENPYVVVGEVGLLKAKQVSSPGAFMDWGVMKDLLVPFREQTEPIEEGRWYLVYVYLDRVTNRIVGSTKLNKYIGNKPPRYQPGDEVEIIVARRAEIGYRVIVDNLHWGMVYKNDVFDTLRIGDVMHGVVKLVRDDGKVDVTFREQGGERVFQLARHIVGYLEDNNGVMRLCDKSHPDDIKAVFHCSKKDFKKALGYLFKRRRILVADNGVKLLNCQNDKNIQ